MAATYSTTSEMRGGTEIYSLREAGGAHAEVAPGLGNNCFAFGAPTPVLEPVAFEQFLLRPTSYGIPILFPFPNRIRDGRFTFQGESFAVNPSRHGFVRDRAWRVEASGAGDDDGAWITSAFEAEWYRDEILDQFPFPFRLEVTYRLKSGALEMSTVAQNRGDRDLPLGFGIHPYFRRPEEGTLEVPAAQRWELSDSLPTGTLLDVEGSYDLRRAADVATLSLDDIFTGIRPGGVTRCLLDDRREKRRTVIEFDAAKFPAVVVYTPPAPRQAICIEPNTCPTDAFNLAERGIDSNVIVLPPGSSIDFGVRIFTEA